MSYMLQKCSLWKVAGVFFTSPTVQHNIADIGRITDLAHTSVALHLRTLRKENLIVEQKTKHGTRVFTTYAAQQSKAFRQYKEVHNLLALQESGIISKLQDELSPKCIVLFGSYLRGEDTEDSDIDIFIQTKGTIDANKYEKLLHRRIQLHSKEDFSRYPPELKNNILNGLVVAGYIQAYR